MDSWFISVAVTVNLCAFSFFFLLLLFNTTLGPFVEKNVTLKLKLRFNSIFFEETLQSTITT